MMAIGNSIVKHLPTKIKDAYIVRLETELAMETSSMQTNLHSRLSFLPVSTFIMSWLYFSTSSFVLCTPRELCKFLIRFFLLSFVVLKYFGGHFDRHTF